MDEDKGPPRKIAASEAKRKTSVHGVSSSDNDKRFFNYSDTVSQFSSSFMSGEKLPDASSEKDLVGDAGNWK